MWHYGEALKDIVRVWTNLLWFLYNYFSLPLLSRTLFVPWRRIHEERSKKGFSVEDIAEKVVTNTIMRLVGALVRFSIIVMGTVVIFIFFWAGLLFYIVWIFMPLLIPVSFFYGLSVLLGMS